MKTIELAYSELRLFYCPNCKAIYLVELECDCPNLVCVPDSEGGRTDE